MNSYSKEQNAENEFISNFSKNFITLPRANTNDEKLLKRDISFFNALNQEVYNSEETSSPAQILDLSMVKVLNNKSQHSMSILNENSQKIPRLLKLKEKKQKVDLILSNRYSQFKSSMSKNIHRLESLYQQHFGSIQTINRQLERHQLTKEELISYYAKILPKNTNFPQKIEKYKQKSNSKQSLPKIRSQSEKNISPFYHKNLAKQSTKKQLKHNKWYIDPEKRFLFNKDKQIYDWRTKEGLKNVIRTQQLKVKGKKINELIDQVKQKFNREPIFCKYVKLS